MSPTVSADRGRLVHALAAEWRTPTSDPAAPTILEQPQTVGGALHVYAVWDAWASVDRAERHEILMDAAETVKPLDELMRITQAWALLPDEADRLNLPWREFATRP
jgi:hypothetical protein